MKEMTSREFYLAVLNAETLPVEIRDFAVHALEKMDSANQARRTKALEKAAEREAERAPMREAIMAVMTKEFKTAAMLIAESGVELKPQAIPSLLKGFVEDGTLVKDKISVGKSKQVGYALA